LVEFEPDSVIISQGEVISVPLFLINGQVKMQTEQAPSMKHRQMSVTGQAKEILGSNVVGKIDKGNWIC
jgi:hypothetical protein